MAKPFSGSSARIQKQEVQGALDKVRRFAHAHHAVTEDKVQAFPSVSKGSSRGFRGREGEDAPCTGRKENGKRKGKVAKEPPRSGARQQAREHRSRGTEEAGAPTTEVSLNALKR